MRHTEFNVSCVWYEGHCLTLGQWNSMNQYIVKFKWKLMSWNSIILHWYVWHGAFYAMFFMRSRDNRKFDTHSLSTQLWQIVCVCVLTNIIKRESDYQKKKIIKINVCKYRSGSSSDCHVASDINRFNILFTIRNCLCSFAEQLWHVTNICTELLFLLLSCHCCCYSHKRA